MTAEGEQSQPWASQADRGGEGTEEGAARVGTHEKKQEEDQGT